MDQELVKYKNDLKISKKSKDDMVNKKAKSFRLTDRDFEIFAFLLEQKFAMLAEFLHVSLQRLAGARSGAMERSEPDFHLPLLRALRLHPPERGPTHQQGGQQQACQQLHQAFEHGHVLVRVLITWRG